MAEFEATLVRNNGVRANTIKTLQEYKFILHIINIKYVP